MPVHKAGKGKWQWGHQKIYRTKWQAQKQGRAIAISEARAAGHSIPRKPGIHKVKRR